MGMFGPFPAGPSDLLRAGVIGLHLDFTAAVCMMVPLLLWCVLMPNRWFAAGWHRFAMSAATLLFWTVQVFLLFVEYFFFDEFRSRFNTVAIDYLMYPHEVFINIRDSYPIWWIVAAAVIGGIMSFFIARRFSTYTWNPVPAKMRFTSLLIWLGLAGGLAATVTLNEAKFSNERTLNEVSNNGAISFLTAAWSHNLDYNAYYKTMDKAEAFARTRKLLQQEGTQFVSEPLSLRKHVAGDASRPKLNVVIFLEESLGSEFWGSLGRKSQTLTPELDKLTTEGLLFENIYATEIAPFAEWKVCSRRFPRCREIRSSNAIILKTSRPSRAFSSAMVMTRCSCMEDAGCLMACAHLQPKRLRAFIEQKDFFEPHLHNHLGRVQRRFIQPNAGRNEGGVQNGPPVFRDGAFRIQPQTVSLPARTDP